MNRKDFIKLIGATPLMLSAMELKDFTKLSQEMPGNDKMPLLFVGHGSPTNAIEDNPFTKSLVKTGQTITGKYKPTAILVVSAHWLSNGTFVNISENPEIIYDFGGFQDELYQVKYPVKGSPTSAHEASKLSTRVIETDQWGIDHGAWTILKHLFPKADIPVFQMSIDYHKPMSYHFELAQELNKLREKGILIIGSGNIVHNLRMSFAGGLDPNKPPYDWAIEFDEWIKNNLNKKDFNSIVNYETLGEAAKLSVPTVDHYVPLIYTLGLSDKKEDITTLYESVELGGISMRTFMIG